MTRRRHSELARNLFPSYKRFFTSHEILCGCSEGWSVVIPSETRNLCVIDILFFLVKPNKKDKVLYGENGRIEKSKDGRCCDEGTCEDIEWIKTSYLNFFDVPRGQERILLNIQVDTIEDAFYKWYQIH